MKYNVSGDIVNLNNIESSGFGSIYGVACSSFLSEFTKNRLLAPTHDEISIQILI